MLRIRRLCPMLLVVVATGSVASSATAKTAPNGGADPEQALSAEARIAPSADAYVSRAHVRANYGRAGSLRVAGRPDIRTYLRFVVPSLQGTITRVSLELYGANG